MQKTVKQQQKNVRETRAVFVLPGTNSALHGFPEFTPSTHHAVCFEPLISVVINTLGSEK
jgi:hypothetical protein